MHCYNNVRERGLSNREECLIMAANTVITIGRQYGSGGKEVGLRLAEELGIKCYDKELLDRAAKDSG